MFYYHYDATVAGGLIGHGRFFSLVAIFHVRMYLGGGLCAGCSFHSLVSIWLRGEKKIVACEKISLKL